MKGQIFFQFLLRCKPVIFNDWLAPQQKLNEGDDNNYTSEEGKIFLGASQPLPCLEHKQYLPVPSEQKNQQKK